MTKREKENIISAWNETEETLESLNTLDNEEIISCLDALKTRLTIAVDLLGELFTDEEAKNQIGH